MALLNEKRNRIPLVAVLPLTGADNSIRGQLRMSDVNGETTINVCTTGGGVLASTLSHVFAAADSVTYTSVAVGDAGALVSVEHKIGGTGAAPTVTVVGYAIVVTGDAAATTNNDIVTAIEASAAASALVTVAAVGVIGDFIAVDAATNLTGGERVAATDVTNDITITANEPGLVGNDITIAIIDVALHVGASVVVTGTDIVVTTDAGVATNQDVFTALDANRASRKLVTATGTGGTTVVAQAETALTGGLSRSVWVELLA